MVLTICETCRKTFSIENKMKQVDYPGKDPQKISRRNCQFNIVAMHEFAMKTREYNLILYNSNNNDNVRIYG